MTIAATIDTSALRAFNARIVHVAENEAVPQVAGTGRRLVLEKTAAGVDAFDDTFALYSESYARRMGIPRSPKTLKRDEGRLYDLSHCPDNTDAFFLTVPADVVPIARGQMSGGGGKWPYKHKFLTLSHTSLGVALRELTSHVRGRLHA